MEEVAIKDRCLQTKYRNLVLVSLDGSKTPDWVPDTYINSDAKTYSIIELTGVIKTRSQELGAVARAPSPAERAALVESRRAFDAETARLLDNGTVDWIRTRDELHQGIRENAAAVGAMTGWQLETGWGP